MFTFSGYLAPGAYAVQLAIRIAVFLVFMVASPFLGGAPCRSGDCIASFLLILVIVKPLVYLVFIFSLLGITVRRLNDADLPAWLLMPLVLLLLKDTDIAVLAGTHVGLAAGYAKHLGGPLYILTVLLCLVALCFVPTREEQGSRTTAAKAIGGALVAVLVALIAVPALVPFVAPAPQNVQQMKRVTELPRPKSERRQRELRDAPRNGPTLEQMRNAQQIGIWFLGATYWSAKTYPYRKAALPLVLALAAAFVALDRFGSTRPAAPAQVPPPPPPSPTPRRQGPPPFRPVPAPAFGRRA